MQVVYGPGTFINEAAGQVLDRINFDRSRAAGGGRSRRPRGAPGGRGARAARPPTRSGSPRRPAQVVDAKYAQRALELAVRFGLSSVPALNNPDFVLRLVFEPSLGAETPKPRFAYLFPHTDAAVIQARLRPGLSEDERREAMAMVREAVAGKAFDLKFGSYVVSGSRWSRRESRRASRTTAASCSRRSLIVLALALLLVFRARPGCCRWRSRSPRRR